MGKELHIIYLRPDLSFTSALKPIYAEPNCLASLASCNMTPVEISKKVSFEFWYFHAFALWLIHNIYWAPVSFFKRWKGRWSHFVNLQLISFICADSNSSRSNPVNLGHGYHSIIYKGERVLQFSKKMFFCPSWCRPWTTKSSLKSCLPLWAWLFHSVLLTFNSRFPSITYKQSRFFFYIILHILISQWCYSLSRVLFWVFFCCVCVFSPVCDCHTHHYLKKKKKFVVMLLASLIFEEHL